MSEQTRRTLRELCVFVLLVAIGVAGRWGQPAWCFTPLAAVTLFAGYYFSRWPVAALVPVASMAISDQILPAYDHGAVFLATYGIMCFPLLLGRAARQAECQGTTGWRAAGWGLACGLLPATLFYLVTNFTVWVSTGMYDKTWTGLIQCYWAAVPFFRWMLTGDLFYLALLVSCYAIATGKFRRAAHAGGRAAS